MFNLNIGHKQSLLSYIKVSVMQLITPTSQSLRTSRLFESHTMKVTEQQLHVYRIYVNAAPRKFIVTTHYDVDIQKVPKAVGWGEEVQIRKAVCDGSEHQIGYQIKIQFVSESFFICHIYFLVYSVPFHAIRTYTVVLYGFLGLKLLCMHSRDQSIHP